MFKSFIDYHKYTIGKKLVNHFRILYAACCIAPSSPLAKTAKYDYGAYLLHSLQSIRDSFINPIISLNDALQIAANRLVC